MEPGHRIPRFLLPWSWEWSAPGTASLLVPKQQAVCQATCRVEHWHKLPGVSVQPEWAQLRGDLRTAVLLKEIFVS